MPVDEAREHVQAALDDDEPAGDPMLEAALAALERAGSVRSAPASPAVPNGGPPDDDSDNDDDGGGERRGDGDGDPGEAESGDGHHFRTDHETDEDQLAALDYGRAETVTELVDLPSATWARSYRAAEASAFETVADWIAAQARRTLDQRAAHRRETHTVDLTIDAETWEAIRLTAAEKIQAGVAPALAWGDAELLHVETRANLVVDGDVKALTDVPGVDRDDECGDGAGAAEEGDR